MMLQMSNLNHGLVYRMPEKKVSIIMPVYNAENFVFDAINSILNQTYKNFELIIIDDCSVDKSLEIIESIHDNRIIIIKNTLNLGLSKSLNLGIKKASGFYTARMDSDDISFPDRISEQVEFMNSNPDVGVSGTSSYILRNSRKIEGHKHFLENDILKFMTIFDCYFVHPSVIFKSSLLKNNNYSIKKNVNPPEDFELWNRLSYKTNFANLDKRLIIYREGNHNISFKDKNIIDERVNKLALKNIVNLTNSHNYNFEYLIDFFRNKLATISLKKFLFNVVPAFYFLLWAANKRFNFKFLSIIKINVIFYRNSINYLILKFKTLSRQLISIPLSYFHSIFFKFIFIFIRFFSKTTSSFTAQKNVKPAIVFWLTYNEANVFGSKNPDSLYTNIYNEFSKSFQVYEVWDKIPLQRLSDAKHVFFNHTYLRYHFDSIGIIFRFFKNYKNTLKILKYGAFVEPQNSYLVALEPPAVLPLNYTAETCTLYKYVFTYDDSKIANNPSKYKKIFFPGSIRYPIKLYPFSKRMFICNFSANKYSSHPDELYSERILAINFFENKMSNKKNIFNLFGSGWSERKSYMGYANDKLNTLSNYKFNICFENQKNISGYVTEKIIDSFLAQSVPIYFGSSDISKLVPYKAFIDFRNFSSYDDLYDYIYNMPYITWVKYIKNGQLFLKSKHFQNFLPDHFIKSVMEHL
jgi:glycosyltransferase involved in cell wall biosynthesis